MKKPTSNEALFLVAFPFIGIGLVMVIVWTMHLVQWLVNAPQ